MKRPEIKRIQAWLERDVRANPLVLAGERGVGKRYILKSALARLDHSVVMHEVAIREGDFYQFRDLISSEDGSIELHYRQTVLSLMNEYTSDANAIVLFKNFEYCDKEHLFLVDTILRHVESSARSCNLVFSLNKCTAPLDSAADYVIVEPMTNKAMSKWLKKKVFVKDTDKSVVSRVATLARGNIGMSRIVCGILKNLGILDEVGRRYRLSAGYAPCNMPSTIEELYRRQMECLDLHSKLSLECVLPFGRAAHVNLIGNVREIHDTHQPSKAKADFENLAKDRLLIVENGARNESILFDRSFELRTDHISQAVRNQSNRIGAYESSVRLYLEEYLSDQNRFSDLSFIDQYETLSFLGDIRAGACDKNFKAVVDLMEALLDKGFFARVCEIADIVLDAWNQNAKRVQSNDPRFFDIYFWALHNLGNNSELVRYRYSPLPCRARLIVARAIHDSGDPQSAISYIENSEPCDEEYKPFSFLLIAAAYDWLGDNERTAHFLDAARRRRCEVHASDLDAFDTFLLKNSLTGNLALSEKSRSNLIERCELYMNDSMHITDSPMYKPKLECISNAGASLVEDFKHDDLRKKGMEFLTFAEKGLANLCDSEVYYTKNAIALNHCFCEDFEKALKVYDTIGLRDDMPPFCWLVIKGNIWGIARILGRKQLAERCQRETDVWLETVYAQAMHNASEDVAAVKTLAQKHPDIGLPLRQYAINRGEACISDGRRSEALAWYLCAREATSYSSNSGGLIDVRLAELKGGLISDGFAENDVKSLSHFYVKHHAFLCALMFWG